MPGEGSRRGRSGEWWWREQPLLKLLREEPDEPEVPAPEGTLRLSRLGMKVVAFDTQFPPETQRDHRRFRQSTTWHGYRSLVPWARTRQVAWCHVGRIKLKWNGTWIWSSRSPTRSLSCSFLFHHIVVHQILSSSFMPTFQHS